MKQSKIKQCLFSITALLVVATAPAVGVGAASNGNDNPGNKVTLCHATGSQTNPFVTITVNANGAVSGHAGGSHQSGRDIIPPFTYNEHGSNQSFGGQNYDAAGQATLNNGCVAPTGGQGGGNPSGGSVLGANTNAAQGGVGAGSAGVGAGVTPQGGVAAGAGGAGAPNPQALIGLGGSLLTLASGAIWAVRRKLFV